MDLDIRTVSFKPTTPPKTESRSCSNGHSRLVSYSNRKNEMAMGSRCQIMDMAQNWGNLSEMGSEWSPGAVKEGPRFRST